MLAVASVTVKSHILLKARKQLQPIVGKGEAYN